MPYRISAKPIIPEYKHGIWRDIKRFVLRAFIKANIWSNKFPIWPITPFRARSRRYETGKLIYKRSPQSLLQAQLRPRRPRPWVDPAPMIPPTNKTRVQEHDEIYQVTYINKMPEDWKSYMNSKGFDTGFITHRAFEMNNDLKILNKVDWEHHRTSWLNEKKNGQ